MDIDSFGFFSFILFIHRGQNLFERLIPVVIFFGNGMKLAFQCKLCV